ncbi:MAG TPA: TIGR01777 family oxidoreductase [Chthoniobacterales bacterium]|nr:TIGR01777 family oxidoreductase [Chthoniobacterales bacterium]
MKIVIAGGTGQIGAILCRAFSAAGDEVIVLTRNAGAHSACRCVFWDGKTLCRWTRELEGADVVINLAGRSVNCRYGKENRREILDSRVDSVRVIRHALENAKQPPRIWLQAATATIYAHRLNAPNDEFTGLIGGDEPNAPETWRFSVDVAKAWEQAVTKSGPLAGTRTVIMRSAMTMSPDRGGIFAHLLGVVRFGIGGPTASGRQFVSWIHETDFVRALGFLIDHDGISGVVNICSPNPLPNSEFMRELRRAWGTRIAFPTTRWMLEIGTLLMRSESELVLKSRRVVPTLLLQHGFKFRFPYWLEAATELCARYRRGRAVAR